MNRFAMSVDAYMTAPVHCVPCDTPLEAVAAELSARRVSCLAVVDGERIVGVAAATRGRRVIATADGAMKGILTGLDFARATQT